MHLRATAEYPFAVVALVRVAAVASRGLRRSTIGDYPRVRQVENANCAHSRH